MTMNRWTGFGLAFPPSLLLIFSYTEYTESKRQRGGVPHVGHFALTAGLLDSLAASPDARIVNVSSISQTEGGTDADRVPCVSQA